MTKKQEEKIIKCYHEIALYSGKQIETNREHINVDGKKASLDELLTCARCSTVVLRGEQYEQLKNSMAEIYHGKGMYKRYKVYRKKLK